MRIWKFWLWDFLPYQSFLFYFLERLITGSASVSGKTKTLAPTNPFNGWVFQSLAIHPQAFKTSEASLKREALLFGGGGSCFCLHASIFSWTYKNKIGPA